MSKYFNIHQNDDKTIDISTKDGKNITHDATRCEINPKQPQYVRVCHGNYWWSLYDQNGHIMPDASYVYDIVLNDDGSYHIKECGYESQWTRYDNGVTRKKIMKQVGIGLSYLGIVLCAFGLQRDCAGCTSNVDFAYPSPEKNPVLISSQKNKTKLPQTSNISHER